MTYDRNDPKTWPVVSGELPGKSVEDCIDALVRALVESKGWLRDYADAIVRDAVDRVAPWTQVIEAKPPSGQIVLAFYRDAFGKGRIIRAMWCLPKHVESDTDSDIAEYDEETDKYWDPEGWYECMDNWDQFRTIMVHEGEVSYWTPLPDEPEVKL